jgi:hypothetical protein
MRNPTYALQLRIDINTTPFPTEAFARNYLDFVITITVQY